MASAALDHIGLLDDNLPIPVVNRPGKIEILPFLGHLHLGLWASELSLLELGVLFINHEPPQEIKSSTDDTHLLRIEEVESLEEALPLDSGRYGHLYRWCSSH